MKTFAQLWRAVRHMLRVRCKKHGDLDVNGDAGEPCRLAGVGEVRSNGTLLEDILFICRLREFELLVQRHATMLVRLEGNGSITAFGKIITPPDFEGITCDGH